MHAFKKEHKMCDLLQQALPSCRNRPSPMLKRSRNWSETRSSTCPLQKAGDRIVATGIVPYPPGIPLLAPGERTGKLKEPVLQYLKSLQDFDNAFPGFSNTIPTGSRM